MYVFCSEWSRGVIELKAELVQPFRRYDCDALITGFEKDQSVDHHVTMHAPGDVREMSRSRKVRCPADFERLGTRAVDPGRRAWSDAGRRCSFDKEWLRSVQPGVQMEDFEVTDTPCIRGFKRKIQLALKVG